jgi:hypothetical protein
LGGSGNPDPDNPEPGDPLPEPIPTVTDPIVTPTMHPTAVPASPRPAQLTSSITFNASPEPLKAGANVKLSGVAGYGINLNEATVRFYFRSQRASTYTLITSTRAASAGKFSTQTRQTTSGTWKAVYAGNSVRRSIESAADFVEARAWRYVRV